MKTKKVRILGKGNWGTSIGSLLEKNKVEVSFSDFNENVANWAQGADFIFIALPVQYLRKTLQKFTPPGVPILALSKGIEISTGERVSQIIRTEWKEQRVAALSGPNLACEVASGTPSASVIASDVEGLAQKFQELFHQSTMRTYRSQDLIGVEMGGSLKNIYAIAGGLCLGLKLGENAQAALLTRALAEMMRIGAVHGAKPETFQGLSGVGDLFLTANSQQSRNFQAGLALSQGDTLETLKEKIKTVIEGIPTTKAICEDPLLANTSKPLAQSIYQILYEGKSALEAVSDVLKRPVEEETV